MKIYVNNIWENGTIVTFWAGSKIAWHFRKPSSANLQPIFNSRKPGRRNIKESDKFYIIEGVLIDGG